MSLFFKVPSALSREILMMDSKKTYGLCLFQKETRHGLVLKDMLQLVKSQNPGKIVNFSYVEAQSSLLPNLSLWENLQLEAGVSKWSDLTTSLKPEWLPLLNLLSRPQTQVSDAHLWEKFALSLLKSMVGSSGHILIDMNEEILSPFMIQVFKNVCIQIAPEKNVVLATANSSLWLDCANSLVTRKGFQFQVEKLDEEKLKAHWVA